MEIKFFVPGVPATGGSKKGFYNPKTKRVVIVDDCKRNKPWRSQVAAFAMPHRPEKLINSALEIFVDFIFTRPKCHYGSGKNESKLKPSAPKYHVKLPDTTKLFRALEDALTGVIWKDDAQIIKQTLRKHYGDFPGARVIIKLVE